MGWMMTQHIRISQFVITYGPGAIIEGVEGPRVIPRADIGLPKDIRLSDYEISDQRMTQRLLGGARIYRLPSNAELGAPENSNVYATKPFPCWKLCLNDQRHGGDFYVLYAGERCPVCGNAGRKGCEAIRFIKACPDGHMDEMDWYFLAHGSDSSCQHSGWFRWYGGGGAISNIEVECPICGSKKFTLGWAYGRDLLCSGRFPEKEPLCSYPLKTGCNKNAKIVQRQASNLRIPELLTLFSIPLRHTELHNMLQGSPIYENIMGSDITSKTQLESILHNLEQRNCISRNTVAEILRHTWGEIYGAIKGILSPIPSSYHHLILEEFHALNLGSVEGIPPIRLPTPESPVAIEVNPNLVRKFPCEKGTSFRVTPVLRLKTVTVQRGYRRAVDTRVLSKLVDVSFPDPTKPTQKWYPGVAFLGEGIFITINDNDGWNFKVEGETAHRWMDAFNNPSSYPDQVFRDPSVREELHPIFVWWHTFGHLLIRAIATEAGYSSAAIRERIYLEAQESKVRGGALLYATQPGSEGTLGGLVALVPYFQDMLDLAFEQLRACSADPLCSEQKFRGGSYNGAACYGCLLISETSCEHRNMWLDRNILLENLP
jgi:hypothetical protein